MAIDVRFFASLAESVGATKARCELPHGATVEDLWAELGRTYPTLGRLSYRPLVACDRDYSDWDRVLDDVSEVAFLPPVSGG